MYKGYKIDVNGGLLDEHNYYSIGINLHAKAKESIRQELSDYTSQDEVIDGSKIQANWFPEIKADVFISHSHTDEKDAIILAGWLKQVFELDAFVDSCIWGNSNELLKSIDDTHCRNPNGQNYSYERRNHSTAHIHMILMTALNKMIDRAECLFFLNTDNSVRLDGIRTQTLSPWIYGEIETSRLIKRHAPARLIKPQTAILEKGGRAMFSDSHSPQVAHNLDLHHLQPLTLNVLTEWAHGAKQRGESELDRLYQFTGQTSMRK